MIDMLYHARIGLVFLCLLGRSRAFEAVSTNSPNAELFPHVTGHVLQPKHTAVRGPKQTNKFWANWIISDPVAGNGAVHAIYPMPYVLKLGSSRELKASQNPEAMMWYQDGRLMNRDGSRLELYRTAFVGEFGLGAVEIGGQHDFQIIKEGVFGIHVEVRNPTANVSMMYPIYSGMAYVSARYTGATPKITTERSRFGDVFAFNNLVQISKGVWSVSTGFHHLSPQSAQLRIYLLDADLGFVDDSFQLELGCERSCLLLNRPLTGWVRAARVLAPRDVETLDLHAPAIPVGWDLQMEDQGHVRYKFEVAGGNSSLPKLLHWAYAHHQKMLQHENTTKMAKGLSSSQAPTKGHMAGVLGNEWLLKAQFFNETNKLDFLPVMPALSAERQARLIEETKATLQELKRTWRQSMFKSDFYFSGKGFQKVGMVCLLAEKLLSSQELELCTRWLARGFECILYKSKHPDDRSSRCAGAPGGLFYDKDWGGLPSRVGYNPTWHSKPVLHCMLADFGNSCYNDHHYHFGYFVVSAAILAKLKPSWTKNADFVNFVDGLIRDTSNPSSEDPYFPRFRHFDWFDLHSWSRGLAPNPEGKDEESTSEEMNLHYGIHLWGKETGRRSMQQLGATMLAMATATVQEFFLMAEGNPHHPADYARNRAPGMLLQNKAHYATYFGKHFEYIHGIQMIPLSPALTLARTRKFNQQEWSEILCNLPLSSTDSWTSILLTGNLAMIDPQAAFDRLEEMHPQSMDDGLTKAYALYWTSAQPAKEGNWSCSHPFFHGPRVCAAGEYRGEAQCHKCPAGTWNNRTNQTSHTACSACEAGRYSSQVGLTSKEACQPCPSGTWSTSGAVELDACIPCKRERPGGPCQIARTPSTTEASSYFRTSNSSAERSPKSVLEQTGMSSDSRTVIHVMMVAALLWSAAGALTSCYRLLTPAA
ncbi:unnamed protein product [Durusdinium trenchii]|uniref:glucan endo-1,3-beta-D-glucosidase n=1 Tax=Durusdinium trenchii TaxID=1381693 RepID=A0ABP0NVC1_9DINO